MRNNVTVSSGHVQNNLEAGAAREEVVQGCPLTHRVTSVARGINIHFVEAGVGPLVRFETTIRIFEKQYATRI